MPYILLVLGLLIGVYALYRFIVKANAEQIAALFMAAAALGVALALFYLSVTGRFAAALGILAAAAPVAYGYLKQRKRPRAEQFEEPHTPSRTPILDKKEALDILGLSGEPSEAEIKAAYKRLMKKVHPDTQGSEWMAAKLNDAKDYLLKK